MARENRTWGYDRIVGTLCNLGHRISDQTVGNILRRSQIAPRRSGVARPPARWHRLLHVEVLTWRGLITYYILFFIEVGSRRVSLGGILTAPRVPGQVRHEAPCCTVMLPATKRHVGSESHAKTSWKIKPFRCERNFSRSTAPGRRTRSVYSICREQHRTGRCNLRSMPRIYFFKSQGLWTSPAEAVSL